MAAASPCPGLSNGVTLLYQTADHLDAVNGFHHSASISPASRCGRHTGGTLVAERLYAADYGYEVFVFEVRCNSLITGITVRSSGKKCIVKLF